MNEIKRRIRGKVRQNRSEKFKYINESVNLTTKYLAKYYENRHVYLSRNQREIFELLILSTNKDLELAILNAHHMLDLYPKQIRAVTIITQNLTRKSDEGSRICLVDENDLLENPAVLKGCAAFGERKNWIKQQYLKMRFVYESDIPVLIIDADTFLAQPIYLFSKDNQVLLINQEDFHYPYSKHCRDFFGSTQVLLNFVNHIQLQMPVYYHEFFKHDFDIEWLRWLRIGYKFGEDSPVSEFQTYAGAVLGTLRHDPIIVSLIHETANMENVMLSDFSSILSNFNGDLLTVGNKLLMQN